MNMNAASQPPHRTTSTDSNLGWLLDDLVARTAHVEKAAVLSRDGLAWAPRRRSAARTQNTCRLWLPGSRAWPAAARSHFGAGKVHQTVVEMDGGFLFVTAAGAGTCLAVLAAPQADVGLLAYEMALIVKRLGRHLAAARSRPAGTGEAM